jgi:hypothetical protein
MRVIYWSKISSLVPSRDYVLKIFLLSFYTIKVIRGKPYNELQLAETNKCVFRLIVVPKDKNIPSIKITVFAVKEHY